MTAIPWARRELSGGQPMHASFVTLKVWVPGEHPGTDPATLTLAHPWGVRLFLEALYRRHTLFEDHLFDVVAYEDNRQIGVGTYQVHFADVGQPATWNGPEPITLHAILETGALVGLLPDAWRSMLGDLQRIEQVKRDQLRRDTETPAEREPPTLPLDVRAYVFEEALPGGRVFQVLQALSGQGITWRFYDHEDRLLGEGTCTSLAALRVQLVKVGDLSASEVAALVTGVAGSALELPESAPEED